MLQKAAAFDDTLRRMPRWQRHVKRCFDVISSAAALVLLSPGLLMAALCVKLTSPGPVLYLQERMGHGGRPFTIYKFRSMFRGAEPEGPRLA